MATGTGADPLGIVASVRPMLATAGPLPATDAGWAYEMKWDGVRAIAGIRDGVVRLWSRSGRDITVSYPELQGLAAAAPGGLTALDGEIVAFAGNPWPSFAALQQRMHVASPAQARLLAASQPVCYLAFDLLLRDGAWLLAEPYRRRRALLDELAPRGDSWQVPPAFTGESGARVLAVSAAHHLEGVVAKRLDSRYEPGRRTAGWIKIKNLRRQEVVIGGWKPGGGGRAGLIGSLLVGVHDPAGLQYAGHVGTGFTEQALRMLGGLLAPLRTQTSPFAAPLPPDHARGAVWVLPRLVAEVTFAQWTPSGRLRAGVYQGLRTDKDPADVIREP
jgi:bifunctional non-homologous end joining protein LigD